MDSEFKIYNGIMEEQATPSIFIVSGGVGASGEQLIHTMLAQFPDDAVNVVTVGNIRQSEQIDQVLQKALLSDGLIVSTLVDSHLNNHLNREAARLNVASFDLMGPLIQWVSQKTGTEPLGQPGLYRKLHRVYYDRVAAIDFAMAHDDGKNPEDWPQAEAVIVGVSRVGKTPLSLFLAVLGWKVANYPLVPQLAIPSTLFSLEPHRVFGLTIDPHALVNFRLRRQRHIGAPGSSSYTDPVAVYEEIQDALKLFRQNGFTVINMTNKTIELGADEIIHHLSQSSGQTST